jgi:hypothetical protein
MYMTVGVCFYAGIGHGADVTRFERDLVAEARVKVQSILHKFCAEACELIDIDADTAQISGESEDLGFENVTKYLHTAKQLTFKDLLAKKMQL